MRYSRFLRMPQDLPPQGGYDPIQYKRNLPVKGFRPAWYLVGVAAVMTYGFWRLKVGIDEWNELAREKQWARIHLMPVLQAEEDRDMVRRHYADKAREKELLGREIKVYNSDRSVYLLLMVRTADLLDNTTAVRGLELQSLKGKNLEEAQW